jgi:hypothetical protein
VFGARHEKAEQPNHEQHRGNDPQHMQGEASASKDQYQQQNHQYETHITDPLQTVFFRSILRLTSLVSLTTS